ncbi:hypothetical protein [Rhizobium grahamii]|uniref:hypothetical protein n=1 Tax=Rhizobium grahamii TaxID=1120045 RepID=UPI001677144E|nr:hypothetical protein [Rhizobium grahamii]
MSGLIHPLRPIILRQKTVKECRVGSKYDIDYIIPHTIRPHIVRAAPSDPVK